MQAESAAEVVVHDVDSSRAQLVVERLKESAGDRVRVGGSNDPIGFDVISSATPVGMIDDDPIPIDDGKLTSDMFIGNLATAHRGTKIITAARVAECQRATTWSPRLWT